MKKLIVLFFVLVMCIPTYGGDILVYKMAASFNPSIDFNSTDLNYAESVGTGKLTGYLVVDVKDPNLNQWDANEPNNARIIFYGKTGSSKWYEVIDPNATRTPADANATHTVVGFKNLGGETKSFHTGYIAKDPNAIFLSIVRGEPNLTVDTNGLYCLLYGKLVKTDIGRTISASDANKATVCVPTSLKGNIEQWDTKSGTARFEEWGTMTLSLDLTWTKLVHADGNSVKQTSDRIVTDLVSKGYTP